jgi:hypothetical protein
MPPIAPPNTVVPQQPDQGGGSTPSPIPAPNGGPSSVPGAQWDVLGDLTGWVTATNDTHGNGGPKLSKRLPSSIPMPPAGPAVSSAVGDLIAAGPQGDTPTAQDATADLASLDLALEAVDLSLFEWSIISTTPGNSVQTRSPFEVT